MKHAHYVLIAALLLATSCSRYLRAADRVHEFPEPRLLWLNHHDMVVVDSWRILLGTNGTRVFISSKTGITFPEQQLVPIYAPTIPPELKITGMRVCYNIIGNNPQTKVYRLRLAQFEGTGPGYNVRMEDLAAGNAAPTPPAAGFAFDDPNGFLCVDSSIKGVCLDPRAGTIAAMTGIQLGDPDDRLSISAIGLHFDTGCTPN